MTEQGTQEWRDERAGHITASRIDAVLTKPRKGQKESAVRANYQAQLICERMSGKAIQEDFQSWDMRRGQELEPDARAAYDLLKGVDVVTVGFIPHPNIRLSGASPDGLVGKDGLVQFKCPKRGTHLQWLRAKTVPAEYRLQMLYEMAVTGRQWCDFASYHPEFPEHLQLFVVRLKRDEAEIQNIESEVRKLNAEIDDIIKELSSAQDLETQLKDSLAAVGK